MTAFSVPLARVKRVIPDLLHKFADLIEDTGSATDLQNQGNKHKTHNPPRTIHLKRLIAEISALNDLYWGFQAGTEILLNNRPLSATHPKDFLSERVANHLNVQLIPFESRIRSQIERMYRLCLVDAMALYEAYLYDVLSTHARSVRTSSDSPEAFAKQIIDERYAQRPTKIDQAIGSSFVSGNSLYGLEMEYVYLVCVFRNSIVHSSSILHNEDMKVIRIHVSALDKRIKSQLARHKKLSKELKNVNCQKKEMN